MLQRGKNRVKSIKLGRISDEDQDRGTLAGAIQQVEKTERMLKQYWREDQIDKDLRWEENFIQLYGQSEKNRTSALTILSQLLR